MGVDIERKFLVCGDGWRQGAGQRLVQGYLNRDKLRTVRVRVAGEMGFLTIKGPTQGATRVEFEYPIAEADAHALLALCDGPLVDKVRYRIPAGNVVWEVDVFAGDNVGLVVAEVELPSEDAAFVRPDWLGEEVTHDARYFNSNLAQHPFCRW